MAGVKFTVYATPQPQGSMKGYVLPGKNGAKARAILMGDNAKLKPYRGDLTREAMAALRDAGISEPMAGKHVPVRLEMIFYLAKPDTCPKKRLLPTVKPDLSKLIRSTEDALTGILYADDAQVVSYGLTEKRYGSPERVEITATVLDGMDLF